jgi:hypothetical protein
MPTLCMRTDYNGIDDRRRRLATDEWVRPAAGDGNDRSVGHHAPVVAESAYSIVLQFPPHPAGGMPWPKASGIARPQTSDICRGGSRTNDVGPARRRRAGNSRSGAGVEATAPLRLERRRSREEEGEPRPSTRVSSAGARERRRPRSARANGSWAGPRTSRSAEPERGEVQDDQRSQ